MRNQFVADIGDFGKYGLLRSLCGITDPTVTIPDIKLGVVWYTHPDMPGDTGGRHIEYLCPAKVKETHRECDPDLWEALRTLVPDRRQIWRVERLGILPSDTLYFRPSLFDAGWDKKVPGGSQASAGTVSGCAAAG